MKYNEIERMVYETNASNELGQEVILKEILKDEGGFLRCPSCQGQLWAEFPTLSDLELDHHYSSIKPDDTVSIRVHACRHCCVCYVNPSLLEEVTK